MSTPEKAENSSVTPVSQDADDAVGVGGKRWYVAIVNHNAEVASAEKLTQLGIENYVATQKTVRMWRNGKRKTVYRVVIGSMVFVHCTEQERRNIVALPFIFRFLVDRATAHDFGRPVAVIPNEQIQRLRFILEHADTPVEVSAANYDKGDRVRVIRGALCGAEGQVVATPNGKGELCIFLGLLGCARCEINISDIEPLK